MSGSKEIGAALVVALVVMAGCAGTTPIPEIETPPARVLTVTPTPEPAPPAVMALEGQDCSAMTFVLLTTPDQANDLLPAGFYARDASGLLDVPVASGKAAFVLTWLSCQAATDEPGAVILGTFAIFIEHPRATPDTADRDLFVVEHWDAWPSLASWLASWGTQSAGNASADFTVYADRRMPLPPSLARPDPGPSAMTLAVESEHGAGFEGGLTGTTGYSMDGAVFRFWFTAPAVTLWVDLTPGRNATGSSGFCQYGPDSKYAEWTQETACGENGLLGLVLPSADVVASGVVKKEA